MKFIGYLFNNRGVKVTSGETGGISQEVIVLAADSQVDEGLQLERKRYKLF